MINVNLLPWRERLADERKQRFFVLCGVAVGAALVLGFGANVITDQAIASQQVRNNILTTSISALDRQIAVIDELKAQKALLISRLNIIQNLQLDRPETVKLFDELVRSVPDGVVLVDLQHNAEESRLRFSGLAESTDHVSDLMRRLDASHKFADPRMPKVDTIVSRLGDRSSSFLMEVVVLDKPAEAGQ